MIMMSTNSNLISCDALNLEWNGRSEKQNDYSRKICPYEELIFSSL